MAGIGSSVVGCVLVVAVFAARPAQAERIDDDPAPADQIKGEPERWYGWQTLTTDGAAMGLWLVAIPATEQAEVNLLGIGALSFAFGAPIVHVAHSRPWVGAGSFGLRVALPVLGIMVGRMLDEPKGVPQCPDPRVRAR